MGFARAADVPVVLVGDIDRGGVIAQPRRHPGGARRRGRGDDRGLHRQQVPRRSHAVRRRHAHRSASAPAGAALGLVPCFADARRLPAEDAVGLAGRRRRGAEAAGRHRRARAAAHRQFRRSRSAARRARRRARLRRARTSRCPATPTSSSCPARRRPSPISPSLRDARLGHRPRGASAARRPRARASAAATRCSAARSPIPTASRDRPATVDGLGLLDVETVLTGDKTARSRHRHEPRRRRARSRATRCISGGPRARTCARPVAALRRRPAGRRGVRRRPGRRQLPPRPVRRRRPARRLAAPGSGAGHRASRYEADVEATLDALAAHLEAHLDCDRLLEPRALTQPATQRSRPAPTSWITQAAR